MTSMRYGTPLVMIIQAILMEIHPSYRLDRHFRLAARQAGKVSIIVCVGVVAIGLEEGLKCVQQKPSFASQASDA